ncbi:MAG: hypothetical protein GY828_05295 [Candidatus Gracilibacteria bacterium]|nr:hypothetical protein [Candidatus Gracilibacteria bacterium]
MLFIIFFLLIAQPYFYRAFLDFKNPELGKICYARDVARYTNNNYVAGSQCFKVFEPFRFYPWMHEFGRTWEELSTKQK